MIIDTHSHLFDEAFTGEVKDCIKRAKEANVNKIILVGFSKETNNLAISYAKEDNIFYPTAGLHPSEASLNYLEDLAYLEDFICNKLEPNESNLSIEEINEFVTNLINSGVLTGDKAIEAHRKKAGELEELLREAEKIRQAV